MATMEQRVSQLESAIGTMAKKSDITEVVASFKADNAVIREDIAKLDRKLSGQIDGLAGQVGLILDHLGIERSTEVQRAAPIIPSVTDRPWSRDQRG